jgi:hypothetical protein
MYRTQSPDTSENAERVQIDILRKMGVGGRTHRMRSMTHHAILRARKAIATANPHLDEHGVTIEFVSTVYGDDLARKFRAACEMRRS